jgi:hypothetical protein
MTAMNVFESLIDELKEENLLENTILDNREKPQVVAAESLDPVVPAPNAAPVEEFEMEEGGVRLYDGRDSSMRMSDGDTVEIRKPTSQREYFRKRAMDEVSGLQMVEHILTGVEREYAKKKPTPFDEFEVKVALNNFLQVADDVSAADHKEAEFKLMQETAAWCTALALRDEKLLVAHVRRFCENTKPMLSSRAVLAIAKFYRNLPYSEPVRAKFEYLVTRLFSRRNADHTRTLLFGGHAMVGHVQTLYADWASLSLHNGPDDREKAQLAVLSFAEFAKEAQTARKFDDLIQSDLYNRIRQFKENLAEMFFVPEVLVAAIECNVAVGNTYLSLLESERSRFEAEFADDESIDSDNHAPSMATARSLELADIFHQPEAESDTSTVFLSASSPVEPVAEPEKPATAKSTLGALPGVGSYLDAVVTHFAGINRWLVIGSLVMIVASAGLWTWATFFVDEPPPNPSARSYDVANSAVKGELKAGRVLGGTFHGVTLPGWISMPESRKKEVLQKLYQEGAAGGWQKVNLIDATGKTVAFASKERLEIYE